MVAGGNPVTDRPFKVIAAVEIFSATGEAIIRSPDSARLHHPHSINNTAGWERAIHFLIHVSIIPFRRWDTDHRVRPFIFRRDKFRLNLSPKWQMNRDNLLNVINRQIYKERTIIIHFN